MSEFNRKVIKWKGFCLRKFSVRKTSPSAIRSKCVAWLYLPEICELELDQRHQPILDHQVHFLFFVGDRCDSVGPTNAKIMRNSREIHGYSWENLITRTTLLVAFMNFNILKVFNIEPFARFCNIHEGFRIWLISLKLKSFFKRLPGDSWREFILRSPRRFLFKLPTMQ